MNQLLFKVLLGAALVSPGISPSTVLYQQKGKEPDPSVSRQISRVIHRTIEGATIKVQGDVTAIATPVTPSEEDLRTVKDFGDQGVRVLASYLTSKSSLEQHVSLRLLTQFQDRAAFDAIRAFAERSKFAGIRQEAIAMLRGFSPADARPIVERIVKNDVDPSVREYAKHILEGWVSENP